MRGGSVPTDRLIPGRVPIVTKVMDRRNLWTNWDAHGKLMRVTTRFSLGRQRVRLPSGSESLLYGFVYWLMFLLVLEPDNVLRAMRAGYRLAVGMETARILAAALLDAIATPALVALGRRFPLGGSDRTRHIAIHVAANAVLGFILIVASCFLAAWGFERHLAPSLTEVRYQLTANWTLLVFALGALTAIMHVVRHVRVGAQAANVVVDRDHAARIPIRVGGRTRFLDDAEIDWVEAQGNYVALHAGSKVELVRRTLTDFESELNSRRFVRIHRSRIVAVGEIQEMQSLPNGDATLRLRNGRELRVSRRYREEVVRRWSDKGTER